jgi:hypothetical protein
MPANMWVSIPLANANYQILASSKPWSGKSMIRRTRKRRCRRGFATFEIFYVSPIFLAVGIGSTYVARWLFGTTHWSTWTPTAVLGIPLCVAYGFLVPLGLYGALRERFRREAD